MKNSIDRDLKIRKVEYNERYTKDNRNEKNKCKVNVKS